MTIIDEIMAVNQEFVAEGKYIPFITDKYPQKKLAIVTCMDPRILGLLSHALGLKNGDASVIKNAGALVTHPWGSVMRSLLVAVLEQDVTNIMVIGHYDCGMKGLNAPDMLERMREFGISENRLEMLKNAGIDLEGWLTGFECVEDIVRHSVKIIRHHPLMPDSIQVHGLVIHPTTGKLTMICDGSNLEKSGA